MKVNSLVTNQGDDKNVFSQARLVTPLPHVVIVGAGFAGLRCAMGLKNEPVRVTLIDKSNHHLFQPLLYQVATAGLSPADIAQPIRAVVRGGRNIEVIMEAVTGVDATNQDVLLVNRKKSINYDYLVIATGARHSYFAHPEWEKFAPGLKSIEDATAIREKVLLAFEHAEIECDSDAKKRLLTFVIVGGGATGVEMAGSIAELAHRTVSKDFRHINAKAARIILIEAGPRLLSAFSEKLSAKAQKALEKLGVDVLTNARVEQVDEDGVVVSGQRIESCTVVWAAGVRASAAAGWLGAEADRAGRVKVRADLTIPGHPEIFVIGDTAAAMDEEGQSLPGVAPVAMQQGKYVASVIKKKLDGAQRIRPFHYVDKGSLATIGRSSAIAQIGKIQIWGLAAWIAWLAVHIFYLIGFRNRVLVLFQWAWAYLTFQRGARLIISEGEKKK